MANRSYDFEITWSYKEDGNRPENIEDITTVRSTTVGRAISKLVRELNTIEGQIIEKNNPEYIKASELLIMDVRTHKLNNAIIEFKRANGMAGG